MAAEHSGVAVTRLVAGLPATVPFVAPEAIERQSGKPIRLRLGANESAFGPSPHAKKAMREAIADSANYGDPENFELRAALAKTLGTAVDEITVGSGIDDLLGLVVRTFLEPGAAAVTSLGAYPTFNFHVNGYGGKLERIPYKDDRNDLEMLAAATNRTGARIVYLANPDNPSGSWHTSSEIAAFRQTLPGNCLLLLDEAYYDFAPVDAIPPLDPEDRGVIRLRTFSKAHGMAGLRIGYAIAPAETNSAFDKVRLHFGVNRIAQAGALASLADTRYLQSVVTAVTEGRSDYAEVAAELGLAALPSATNFVSIDVGGPRRARALLAALAERGVFIRMPGAPPLDRCVRVTVGTPPERRLFAEILRQVWPEIADLPPG
ncbi:MAG: aminotransferase class I/II-fold pyridoxal phosphate-dependent enzyme [Ktedonobacterales bacterium]